MSIFWVNVLGQIEESEGKQYKLLNFHHHHLHILGVKLVTYYLYPCKVGDQFQVLFMALSRQRLILYISIPFLLSFSPLNEEFRIKDKNNGNYHIGYAPLIPFCKVLCFTLSYNFEVNSKCVYLFMNNR